jgi:hypothetical protein
MGALFFVLLYGVSLVVQQPACNLSASVIRLPSSVAEPDTLCQFVTILTGEQGKTL